MSTTPTPDEAIRIVMWRAVRARGTYDTAALPFPATAAVQAGARAGFWTAAGSVVTLTDKLVSQLDADPARLWAALSDILAASEVDLTVPLPNGRTEQPWASLSEKHGKDIFNLAMKPALGEFLRVTDAGIVCRIGWMVDAAHTPAPAAPRPYDQMDEGLHAPIPHRPKPQAPGTSPLGNSTGLVAGVEMLAQLRRIAAALEEQAANTNPPTEVLQHGTSPVLDTARELAVLLGKGESATASILRRRVCAKRRDLTTAALQFGVEQRAFTRSGSPVYGAEYTLTDPEKLDIPWALIHSLSKKKKPLRQLTA